MSISTGIDIIYLPTFSQSLLSGGQVFKDKLFTPNEQTVFSSIESLAGLFSAKEAIIKALGNSALTPKDIHLTKNATGKPKLIRPELSSDNIDISISHDQDYAISICVILKP